MNLSSLSRSLSALTIFLAVLLARATTTQPQSLPPDQSAFWSKLVSLCGARFEGESVLPRDPGDSFAGKKLVATLATCGESEIRVPFAVGEDRSRTWLITRTPNGLQLKHDHRHADGTPDKITMYGGLARAGGSAEHQAFAADAHTAKLIPEAATNVWTLTLSPDGQSLTYYLERIDKPRFKAVLKRVR